MYNLLCYVAILIGNVTGLAGLCVCSLVCLFISLYTAVNNYILQ